MKSYLNIKYTPKIDVPHRMNSILRIIVSGFEGLLFINVNKPNCKGYMNVESVTLYCRLNVTTSILWWLQHSIITTLHYNIFLKLTELSDGAVERPELRQPRALLELDVEVLQVVVGLRLAHRHAQRGQQTRPPGRHRVNLCNIIFFVTTKYFCPAYIGSE